MGDLSNYTDEQLRAELSKRQAGNSAPAYNVGGPTSVANPADYIGAIGQKWDSMGNGSGASYGRGKTFMDNLAVARNAGIRGNATADQYGNPLPDNAYDYILQRLNAARSRGNVNKHTLRAIQYEASARYLLPENFDISGAGLGNTDYEMAKIINSMPYNSGMSGNSTVVQRSTVDSNPTQRSKPGTGNQVGNSNQAVANAKPGDYLVRKDGSTVVLTQRDIDWAKGKVNPGWQQGTGGKGNKGSTSGTKEISSTARYEELKSLLLKAQASYGEANAMLTGEMNLPPDQERKYMQQKREAAKQMREYQDELNKLSGNTTAKDLAKGFLKGFNPAALNPALSLVKPVYYMAKGLQK